MPPLVLIKMKISAGINADCLPRYCYELCPVAGPVRSLPQQRLGARAGDRRDAFENEPIP